MKNKNRTSNYSDYYAIKTIITKTAYKRQLYILSQKKFPRQNHRLPGKI